MRYAKRSGNWYPLLANETKPTASDNCAVTSVSCSPPSGSDFPVGETTVTCTATDSSGNQNYCTFTVTLVKVELLSDKAANSPKSFECGQTTVALPCGLLAEDAEALIAYHNDVFDYQTKQVQDFNVTLRVSPNDLQGVQWFKVSGPNSGSLINPNEAEAAYSNPKQGGVYQFDATVEGIATRSQLWLPVAAPDISSYWQSEIDYFRNTWGASLQNKVE